MNKKYLILFGILVLLIAGIFLGYYVWSDVGKTKIIENKNQAGFIEEAGLISDSLGTVAFISPHHLVAEKMIDEIFAKTAEKNSGSEIERIVLISPNHFNLGNGWIIASDKNWETKNGKIEADFLGIEKIRKTEGFNVDEKVFQGEHGIENLLPFVAKHFPDVKIIPLMIKDGFPLEASEKFAKVLAENFPQKTLVILSSDFSHELEQNISEFHDQKAIEVIENGEYDKIHNLDTDCAPGLAIVMKYSELLGHKEFELIGSSNSSDIYGKNFIGENTSYVTGFFSQDEVMKKEKTAHLMFFGDWMLDRTNRVLAEKNGAVWMSEKLKRLFWSQDENILNLEGTVTDKNSVSVGTKETERNHFLFTFSPEKTKTFLTENNIGIVSLGNNHSLNFGKEGIIETENNLKNFGTEYFGDPTDENNVLIKEVNGIKIGFIGFNDFSGITAEKTVEKIKEAKRQAEFVVVYAHWGQEYQLTENEKQRSLAHLFIDGGADLIIGSHPHVVQPMEIYKNKAIFYSLGNFVFDQYFSEDVKNRLAVAVSISKDKTEFYLEPLYAEKNGQVVLADGIRRKDLLKRLSETSKADNATKKEILSGKFEIIN